MKKKINSIIVVGLLIIVVAVIGVATTLIMRHIPTRKQMDLTEYWKREQLCQGSSLTFPLTL